STMAWTHFLIFNAAGAVAWATTFGTVGYLLGYSWETIERWIGHLGLVFLALIAAGLSYFDLDFMQLPRIIATAVVHGTGGVALIDPGPTSTLPRLRSALASAGISMQDVRTVLLTHIHLDHAGATGTLVKELPKLRVYVHEKGAPHMASPDKLLASATRLYGSEMDRLWGEVRPVPSGSMHILQ